MRALVGLWVSAPSAVVIRSLILTGLAAFLSLGQLAIWALVAD